MKKLETKHLIAPKFRRAIACLLIFAIVVTLSPVQSLAQTVQREKTVAGQLPDTATYTVRDCTVTYDTVLQEGLSPNINITITNHGQQPVSKWQLRFPCQAILNPSSDIQIDSRENPYYTLTPTKEILEIPSGQSVQFSFSVNGEMVPDAPEEIDLIINDEKFAPLPTATPVPTMAVPATPKPIATATVMPTVAATAAPAVTAPATVTPTTTAVPAVTAAIASTATATITSAVTPASTATAAPSSAPLPTSEITAQVTETPVATVAPQVTQTTVPPAQTIVPPSGFPRYTIVSFTAQMLSDTHETTTEQTSSVTPETTASAQPASGQTTGSAGTPRPASTPEPATTPELSSTLDPAIEPTQQPTAAPVETTEPSQQPAAAPVETTEPAQDLYIYTNTTISQDTTCGNLFLMGGSLTISGCALTVQGDYFQNGGSSSIRNAQIAVGGNLTVTQGTFELAYASTADICGDLRTEGSGRLYLYGRTEVPQLTAGGDFIIHSTSRSSLEYGTLTLPGNLIQEDSGYPQSLAVSDTFTILLCGNERQTIQLAYPEAVTLGTLDFRQTVGVDTPDEIHGNEIIGFDKLDEKEQLDLYLTNTQIKQDETIRSRSVCWHGGKLSFSSHSLSVRGNLEIDKLQNVSASNAALTIQGNFTCATTGKYSLSGGSLTVGGDLTVTQGTFELAHAATADIHGDLRTEGGGRLYLYGRGTVPQLTANGDFIIHSTGWSCLEYGTLTLPGNLIQEDSGYPQSLTVADTFQILFCGNERQTIQLAHPEAVTLGTLDLRQTVGVDTPDEIHGNEIIGFDKLDEKEQLDLYLTNTQLKQDETIHSSSVCWHGGKLSFSSHSLSVRGNLEIDKLQNVSASNAALTIQGNFTCATTSKYSLSGGTLSVGGDLTVTQGTFELAHATTAHIHGDLRTEGNGRLYLYGRSEVPQLTTGGDFIIHSSGWSNLEYGTLTLPGNLIQEDSGYPQSLAVADTFKILLSGNERQTIKLAYPEAVTLGTLDLRQTVGVDTPDEIHGNEIIGFDKLDEKQQLDLYLTNTQLKQDETIRSRSLRWHGGKLSFSSHSLSVRGNLEIDKLQNVSVSDAALTVQGNFTCATTSKYSQLGGTLTVGGDLTVTQGTLELKFAGTADIRGDLRAKDSGRLYLYGRGEIPNVIVYGDMVIESTIQSSLECGTLTLGGSFFQTEDAQTENLTIGSGLKLALNGNDTQTIDLPGVCEIPQLDITKSKGVILNDEYEGDRLYGLEKLVPQGDVLYSNYEYNMLTADTIIPVSFNCGGVLDLGGYNLTVKGNFRQHDSVYLKGGKFSVTGRYTAVEGDLRLDGGILHVGGDMSLQSEASLYFPETYQPYLRVDGNFTTASQSSNNRFLNGTMEVKGNLTETESACKESLNITKTRLVLSGSKKQTVTVQNLAQDIYFGEIDLTESAGVEFVCAGLKVKTITGIRNITNEILTLKNSHITLQQDEILPGQLCLEGSYLDCNGHTLTAKNGFTQADTIVNLNKGALQSGGDYCIMGSSFLQMIRPEDRVRVKRNFIMSSTRNHSNMLRDGRMEVGGDFNQNGDEYSFASSENFVIAFTGSGVHKAHFLDKDCSDFANVDPVFNNYVKSEDAISATTAIYCFAEGFVKGLDEALDIPELAATTLALMAAYGLGAALLPSSLAILAVEAFSLLMLFCSVFMMFNVCGEICDTLDSDMTTEQKAKEFGRLGVLMLLSAMAVHGSLALLSDPVKVQTTLEQTKEMIWLGIKDFTQMVKLITVESVETLIAYGKEFVSEDALAVLQKKASGMDVRQLRELAKMIRQASKEIGSNLQKDDMIVALRKWNETGSVDDALQAALERARWFLHGGYGRTIKTSNKKIYQAGPHYRDHGKPMGYGSKKEYEAAARAFFKDNIDKAEVYEGKWNSSRGVQSNKWQYIIRAKGRQLIINKETGQLIDFYEGISLEGFIEIVRWQ